MIKCIFVATSTTSNNTLRYIEYYRPLYDADVLWHIMLLAISWLLPFYHLRNKLQATERNMNRSSWYLFHSMRFKQGATVVLAHNMFNLRLCSVTL